MLKKVVIVTVVSLLVVELVLRITGHPPGYWVSYYGFHPVEELVEYETYTTDENGIYRFSYWVYDTLQVNYDWRSMKLNGEERFRDKLQRYDQIDYVITSFGELNAGKGSDELKWYTKVIKKFLMPGENWAQSEFVHLIDSLRSSDTTSPFSRAVIGYLKKPFNQDGFRGIEMKVHDTTRTRVLLIGDSFVYGMSAKPYFNSYADILLAKGYEVYAAGIPGTDVAQYAAIAATYVPRLRPDVVIVNFCEQEDLLKFPRNATEGEPHEHYTNAGLFSSYPFGTYLPAAEAYTVYDSLCRIPKGPVLNRILACTSTGSLLWGKLRESRYVHHSYFEHYLAVNDVKTEQKIANTLPHLKKIRNVCDEYGVRLINAIIPDKDADHNRNREMLTIDSTIAAKLFGNEYATPIDLDRSEDFDDGDYHFNNSGSLKFANFIDSLVNVNTKNAKGSLRQSSE